MVTQPLQIILLVTLGHYVRGQAIDLCAGCTIVNGAGYNSHPTDCDKFIQCHYDSADNLVGEIQQCAFSTYWNMGNLTCMPTTQTVCPTDQCIDYPDGTIFPAEGNCRGYWHCEAGRSNAKCCAVGKKYNHGAGGCVDVVDDECKDSCFNDKRMQEECDRFPVPGNPAVYEREVPGFGRIEMPCPPGTHFWRPSCQCYKIVTPDVVKKNKCRAEIFLPFSKDHTDRSGNRFYVGNEDVDVRDGYAVFNGVSSRLIIPRFTNLERSTTVVIKAKYTSDHSEPGLARALVSNSDCGNLPSVMVSEDDTNVYFGVGTSGKRFTYTYVPHQVSDPTQPSSKEFVYKFDAGMLTGSNGAADNMVEAEGSLRNVRCALQIGHADNLVPFKGVIDELTVYLCNPKN